MPNSGISLQVDPRTSRDLARIRADLKKVNNGPKLNRLLNKRIRTAVKPLVEDVQQAAQAIPAKGPGSTGLRGRIAAGIKTSTGVNSVTIRATAALSKEMEGAVPWRHPTYGREPWVTQPSHSYFGNTIARGQGKTIAEVEKVMGDIAKEAGFH